MIKWHVQHDDEIWAGDVCLGAAKDEQQAHEFVNFQNTAVDRMMPRPDASDLRIAFDCLTSWLIDNSIEVFEEQPEIDAARQTIYAKIEELDE
jgi:hypothetical protein